MKTYGYARISSFDQNADRQMLALQAQKIRSENIFLDAKSGQDFDRPAYLQLLKVLKRGDLLYILSIDRLGRNYAEIQRQWYLLTKEIGADICVLDMPLLDTRRGKNQNLMENFIADLVLQILSFVAESERVNIRARQKEGIAAAMARGVRFGRPKKSVPPNFEAILSAFDRREVSLPEALAKSGLSRTGFYRCLQEYRRNRSR